MTQVITIYFNGNSKKTYDYLLNNENNVKIGRNHGFFLETDKGTSGVFVVNVNNIGYLPEHVYTVFKVINNKHAKAEPLQKAERHAINKALYQDNPEKYRYQSTIMWKDKYRQLELEKNITSYEREIFLLKNAIIKQQNGYHTNNSLTKQKKVLQAKQKKVKEFKQEIREIKQRLELYK